jgi:hypothetical protein
MQIPDGETLLSTVAFGYSLVIPQLAHRFDQVFQRNKKTPTGVAEKTAPPGTRIFSGISRLISTKPFENYRVDAEVAVETHPGETFQEAYDRTFQQLGEVIVKALEMGTARDGQESAKSFEWN